MPAANRTETRMLRRETAAFLRAEPIWLTLFRPVLIQDDAGGLVKGPPTQLPEQLVRLVPFKKRLTAMTRDTPDGNIINLSYVLIAEYDADVKPADYFEHEDGLYDVISIEPNRQYRVAANITYRGLNSEVWG